MNMVLNWKPPEEAKHAFNIEEFFRKKGIEISVIQTHRVQTGKLNTTFSGSNENIQKVWNFVKEIEKQEILQRRK